MINLRAAADDDPVAVAEWGWTYIVLLSAIALFVVSFGAKVGRGVRWAAIPLGLVAAQFFLAYAAYSAAIVGVLHGLDALAIFRGRATGRTPGAEGIARG